MADGEGSSSSGPSTRTVAAVAGIGLIALGAYQLSKPGARGATGATGQPGSVGPGGCIGGRNLPGLAFDAWWQKTYNVSYLPAGHGGLNQWINDLIAAYQQDTCVSNLAAGGVWGSDKFTAVYYQLGGPTGLAGTGTGAGSGAGSGGTPAPSPARPAPIDSALLLPPGCIIATSCNGRAGQAWFVESANGTQSIGRDRTTTPWRGKPYYRWKRLVKDNQAWLQLGDPWRAIRLVTSACRDDLANGPDLQSQGGWGWALGPPLNGVINSIAGYCT